MCGCELIKCWDSSEGCASCRTFRIDNQIKLRGHRVELGEIEAILLRHESVKEAVVILSENGQVCCVESGMYKPARRSCSSWPWHYFAD